MHGLLMRESRAAIKQNRHTKHIAGGADAILGLQGALGWSYGSDGKGCVRVATPIPSISIAGWEALADAAMSKVEM
jgi:hypothetical protein